MCLYDSHSKIRFLPEGGFPQMASYLNVKMTLDNNLVIKIWQFGSGVSSASGGLMFKWEPPHLLCWVAGNRQETKKSLPNIDRFTLAYLLSASLGEMTTRSQKEDRHHSHASVISTGISSAQDSQKAMSLKTLFFFLHFSVVSKSKYVKMTHVWRTTVWMQPVQSRLLLLSAERQTHSCPELQSKLSRQKMETWKKIVFKTILGNFHLNQINNLDVKLNNNTFLLPWSWYHSHMPASLLLIA